MLTTAYETATGASGSSNAVRPGEVRNGLIHVTALSSLKCADGLLDPKLVLTWLLGALGAPAALIGAVVPVREAGALLPQIALARLLGRRRTVAPFWAAGAAVQGVAALGIAAAAVSLDGAIAGAAIVSCLAVLACARAACSVSYKDALARTVPKTRRGAVTGIAGTVAAAVALGFAGLLATGALPLSVPVIASAAALAGGLWVTAATIFTGLKERSSRSSSDDAHDATPGGHPLAPFREDPQFARFVLSRALLTGSALAPPFLVMLAGREAETGPGTLGPLMLASGLAALLSSYVWGRVSDRSSRMALALSGGLCALALGTAAILGWTTGGLGGVLAASTCMFVAQIAYQGVRAARKLHLTDMTTDATRARYTALSNTTIGIVLAIGGGFGVLADLAGPETTLGVLAVFAAASVPVSLSLAPVQSPR